MLDTALQQETLKVAVGERASRMVITSTSGPGIFSPWRHSYKFSHYKDVRKKPLPDNLQPSS